jgi:hypothetical protein
LNLEPLTPELSGGGGTTSEHYLDHNGAKHRSPPVGCSALILIEAPSSAYSRGTAGAGKTTSRRGGDLMRFSTQPHHFYCGIDLHARTMYVCLLNRDGEIVVHRNMKASPDALLKVIAPYREDVVVAVEWTLHVVLAG